jgi:hypothetical protein
VRRSPKQIGTDGETRVQRFLVRYFPGVCRLAPAGAQDLGDLGGIPLLTVQVKMGKSMRLAEWVDQAEDQARRADTPFFVVIHHRPRRGDPGQWYTTLPVEVFAGLYAAFLRTQEEVSA